MTVTSPASLLGAYLPASETYDEFVEPSGGPREHWGPLAEALDRLGHRELVRRSAETVRALEQDGVTYNANTADGPLRRAWSLDPLPVVLPAPEWSAIEAGVVQRAHLLDIVLTDLYGERRLLADGSIPHELVFDDPMFLRPCHAIRVPGQHQLFSLAIDLIRDPSGTWTVMSDRAEAPSGAGYAMENRMVISQVFSRIYRRAGVDRLAPYFRTLRSGLQSVAPAGVDEPRIVVLSPGPMSETAFEHAFVAAQLGYPLVEGSDLVVRDGRVWLRTVNRLRPVDVILRRVDSWFCDPLELRPDSELGVAGLVDAARRGAVTLVNPLGSGVLENAGLGVLLPTLAKRLIGEELTLASAPSWWCGDPISRQHVLANLDSLVIRSTARSRGGPTRFGPQLSSAERDELRSAIQARPHRWVGQEILCGSTAPVLARDSYEPRRTVLRTFAVASGHSYAVMTGGLTRVAPDDTSLAVSNQIGAVSKDTWVLSSEPESLSAFWLGGAPLDHETEVDPSAMLSARAAENLFWLGRYAERAEATARLLRAANTRRVEFEHSRPGPGVNALRALLVTLTRVTATYPGFVGDEAERLLETPELELSGLIVDRNRGGAVANSVQRLLDASEAVRDQLSIDTFLVVGALQRELAEMAQTSGAQEDAVQFALGRALQAFLALGGLGAESMVRDPAWRFLDTGRRVERALQVVNLIGAAMGVERDGPTDSLVLESVLTAAESIITYRRRYQSRAHPDTVLDLLLGSADNPRSVRFQLDLLVGHLEELERSSGNTPSKALALARQAVALVDGASSGDLAESDDAGVRHQLERLTSTLRTLLHSLADAVDEENFGRLLPHRSVLTPTDTSLRFVTAPHDNGGGNGGGTTTGGAR